MAEQQAVQYAAATATATATTAAVLDPPAPPSRGLSSARFYPLIVVGLAMMTQGGFTLLGQGFAPFLPFMQQEFGLTNTNIGIFTGAIFIAAAASSTFFGWAIDRVGERLIIGLLMLLGGVSVLLLTVAPGYLALLGIAVLMGVLRSPGNAAGGRAIVGWVSKKRRATAMGLKQAGSSIYSAIAAAAVPIVAVAYGWHAAVVALAVFLAVTAIVIFSLYREPPEAQARKKKAGSLKEGLVEIARNRDAGLAMAVQFMHLGAEVTIATYLIFFLHDGHGMSLIAAGGLLAAFQVTSIFTRVAWGSLSDLLWQGRRKPALYVGGAAAAIALLSLALVPANSPVWVLLLASVGLGATARSLNPLSQTLLAEVTNPTRLGLVLGVSGTFSRSSTFLMPPLFGILADAFDFRIAWLVLAAFMATTLLFLRLVREGQPEEAMEIA